MTNLPATRAGMERRKPDSKSTTKKVEIKTLWFLLAVALGMAFWLTLYIAGPKLFWIAGPALILIGMAFFYGISRLWSRDNHDA